MEAYITYDVSNHGQSEVKSGMKKLGYSDRWKAHDKIYYLPNTTLWKDDTELSQACADIKSVIANINAGRAANNKVHLERCIVVSASPWFGIPGEPHQ